MRAVETLGGLLIVLLLSLASFPWLAWAIGRAALGDDSGADRAIEASPIYRWFDYVDQGRAD